MIQLGLSSAPESPPKAEWAMIVFKCLKLPLKLRNPITHTPAQPIQILEEGPHLENNATQAP